MADAGLQQTRARCSARAAPARRAARFRHQSALYCRPCQALYQARTFSLPTRALAARPQLTCGAAGRAQLLSERERDWVDAYHAQVWAAASPRLAGAPLEWLRAHTLPLPTAGHAAEPAAVAAPPPTAPAAAMVVA